MLPIKRLHIWIDAHRPKRGELHTLGDKAIYELEKIADSLDREITGLRSTTIEQIQELIKLAEEIDELKDQNKQLREYASDLWQYIYFGTPRDGQRLNDRAHELGVKVGK